jgi:hypothetical protein
MATSTHLATDSLAHYPPIMAEAFARLAAQQAATEAQMQLTSRKIDELSESTRALKESTWLINESNNRMGEQLGGIANNQGAVAEEFFYNSLLEQPQIGALKFTKIVRNSVVGHKGQQTEYDLLLVNGKSVVVVEVKYRLRPEHLGKLAAQLVAFKRDHAEFKGFKVYGALAGFYVPATLLEEAAAHGYMVLQRKGGLLVSHTEDLRAH